MGNCFSSTEEKEAKERSTNIDKQIEEDSRKFKKECKILLLGESCCLGAALRVGRRARTWIIAQTLDGRMKERRAWRCSIAADCPTPRMHPGREVECGCSRRMAPSTTIREVLMPRLPSTSLPGAGESGKSTVVKQMKIIHQNGYTPEELMLYRLTVIKNLVDSAQAIVLALRKFKLEPEVPDNRESAELILQYRVDADPNTSLEPAMAKAVEALWADPIVATVVDRSSEFYLMDSAPYFFNNVSRIASPDYIPNEDDVLRARSKTTGITETRFNMGQLSIHLFDVGGQRSERKKWIHCFEAVTSIIFCVALSEYDQVLLEESGQNRMAESLVLFESVVNSRWFLRTSIILFLNKIDIFKQKIPRQPLANFFPEYSGGADVNKAAKYILWRFTQTNRARLSIYPHLTQATDTSNVRLVFAAVKETILQNALSASGIL
ncbi:guanine nucleotide-binding protein alpha-3 subunit [Ceraceosorus guamensis]|uniref:Guanine nucleotide-binding protein alpha-3 subunit n=1 Tax=Ceraceosorus guamensis TaxID=1522189 RepID=A0A316VX60_9BASI|nr:guanine nucleotide-binding protein alpha-3 subunit [Ceraceosorus guamensis]PWN41023.1 guanine nucleotide-binding protein alpha-3 subunit [Ceraceosorus guamensis]